MPSPESPANRMITRSSRSTCLDTYVHFLQLLGRVSPRVPVLGARLTTIVRWQRETDPIPGFGQVTLRTRNRRRPDRSPGRPRRRTQFSANGALEFALADPS
jgi:hypothetical protein